MKLKKIINIFGGPGAGKSTLAASIFSIMKKNGKSVELVTEYAKQMVFEERMNVLGEDQLYIFAKQHRKIFILRNTVEYIVTDSPFVQGITYFNSDVVDQLDFNRLVLGTHHSYPNLNILAIRSEGIKYEQMGRTQNEKEATMKTEEIVDFLHENDIKFNLFLTGKHDEVEFLKELRLV